MSGLIERLFDLGFRESPSNKGFLSISVNGYEIRIIINNSDIYRSVIDYGEQIRVGHSGICNFTRDENFVQMECVIRLLRKNYKPSCIELEKTYPAGHGHSPRLDINIYKGNKTWGMIECKTYGAEYNAEKEKMKQEGSQIFSYLAADRDADVIAIYASTFENNALVYICECIPTLSLDKSGDMNNIFRSWDKNFIYNGIFDKISGVYEIDRKNLRKASLLDLTKETGKSLFNQFAEILRKFVISDKSNAFNVIFNLFVCKIYDEDIKSDEEELDFQIKVGDDDTSILKRLSELYKDSVKKYLSFDMDTNYFASSGKYALKEFSFIDVYSDETFQQNSEILSQVVQLLQKYRIKYSTKHQFLGDFFENLLNTGIKQESGQYFTPVPLARFMLRALPIKEIIDQKTKGKEPYILPHIIDYACGSGHFLTEAIEEVSLFFSGIDNTKLSGQQQRYFISSKDNFLWARDYIYGIEKDNRLAKTAKIAMFLNGDGDASIVNGDGLDDFYYSTKYENKLKAKQPSQSVSAFDIVVSNPPYSVEGFVNTVKNADISFLSSNYVTTKSNEIECFFIERTLQLLKYGGVSAIVLPLSILNNTRSIYTFSRKILLLFTEIIAMVELREKAFKETPTTPCILFFRKKTIEKLKSECESFLYTLEGMPEHDKFKPSLDGFVEKYSGGNLDTDILGVDILPALIGHFVEGKKVVYAYSGQNKRQEFFLGYRFSKARGREGLATLKQSLLYDFNNASNTHNVAGIISNAFNMDYSVNPSGELKKHIDILNLQDVLNATNKNLVFDNPSAILASKTISIDSISPKGDFIDSFPSIVTTFAKLIELNRVEVFGGLIYSKNEDEVPEETQIRVLTASNININTGKLVFDEKIIHLRSDYAFNSTLEIREGDIIISMSSGSLKHLGKVAYATQNYPKLLVGGFLSIIRTKEVNLGLALYYRLMSKEFRNYVFSRKGQNINNLNINEIKNVSIKIPVDLDKFAIDAKSALY